MATLARRPQASIALGADLFNRAKHAGLGFLMLLNCQVGKVGEMLLKERWGFDHIVIQEQTAGHEQVKHFPTELLLALVGEMVQGNS